MSLGVTKNGKSQILVCLEYFPEAISKIKKLGKVNWDSAMKGWVVDENFEDDVKDILVEFYGTDGSFRPKTINIEITALEDIEMLRKPVLFAGKVIAAAYGRDSGARLGDNVVQRSGEIDSAGSAAYWKTTVSKGSCFKVLHVNEELLKHESNNLFSYKTLSSEKKNNLSRLRKVSDEELVQECISRKLEIN